jgi:hypothetical protein
MFQDAAGLNVVSPSGLICVSTVSKNLPRQPSTANTHSSKSNNDGLTLAATPTTWPHNQTNLPPQAQQVLP